MRCTEFEQSVPRARHECSAVEGLKSPSAAISLLSSKRDQEDENWIAIVQIRRASCEWESMVHGITTVDFVGVVPPFVSQLPSLQHALARQRGSKCES